MEVGSEVWFQKMRSELGTPDAELGHRNPEVRNKLRNPSCEPQLENRRRNQYSQPEFDTRNRNLELGNQLRNPHTRHEFGNRIRKSGRVPQTSSWSTLPPASGIMDTDTGGPECSVPIAKACPRCHSECGFRIRNQTSGPNVRSDVRSELGSGVGFRRQRLAPELGFRIQFRRRVPNAGLNPGLWLRVSNLAASIRFRIWLGAPDVRIQFRIRVGNFSWGALAVYRYSRLAFLCFRLLGRGNVWGVYHRGIRLCPGASRWHVNTIA